MYCSPSANGQTAAGKEKWENMATEIYDRVKALFMDKFELKEDALTPEATLESLGLDSLDKIEFMFSIEDEFKISFPDRKVEINTVKDVIEIIEKLTPGAPTARRHKKA